MNLEKHKQMYKDFKNLLNQLSDGDSILSQALRANLTVEQINVISNFIKESEDLGIHLLFNKTKPN